MGQSKWIDNAISVSRLFRQSLWCGIVLALAVVICALNALPPVTIDYEVSSQIFVSQPRLAELDKRASNDARDWFESDESIRIREVKVLDSSNDLDATADEVLTLVEVDTIWTRPYDEHLLESWFKANSQPRAVPDPQSELTRQSDFARWRLRAAKHYRDQHDYLGSRDSAMVTPESVQNTASSNATDDRETAADSSVAAGAVGEDANSGDSINRHSPELLRVAGVKQPRKTFSLASNKSAPTIRNASYRTEVTDGISANEDAGSSPVQNFTDEPNLSNSSSASSPAGDSDSSWSESSLQAMLASTSLPSDDGATSLAPVQKTVVHSSDLVSAASGSDEVIARLDREVLASQEVVQSLTDEMGRKFDEAAGVIEFATVNRVRPLSHPIPLWMAASVIALGFCVAASASWIQQRLHAGSVYSPQTLTRILSNTLPVAGNTKLSGDWVAPTGMFSRMRLRASQSARRIASNMTLACEWTLWFWVYMIAIRFVLDSMWRQVLWENPLAAFGRILWGLP